MRCPICNFEDTKVVDSRMTAEGANIRRRRECIECEYRFSTVEETEILDLAVVKRDGRREPYCRDKIEAGLRRALKKRPCDADALKTLVAGIERDVQRLRKEEIASAEIGEMVMAHLKKFDSVAYIRFASVYKSFADLETFHDELGKLVAKEAVGAGASAAAAAKKRRAVVTRLL